MNPQTAEEFEQNIKHQFDLYETLADMLRPVTESDDSYTDEINY